MGTSRRRVTSEDNVPADTAAREGADIFTISEYVAMFSGWMPVF